MQQSTWLASVGCRKSKGQPDNVMNATTETPSGGLNGLKWLVVVVLVAVAVGANGYYAEQSLLYRVLGLVAVALVALFVAVQTTQGAAFWKLAKEARTEIRKVVWPTRQESTQTTMIVVAFVFVMSLILWGLDTLLGWLVSLVIG
jgi:preprotein translocase subunit SecE